MGLSTNQLRIYFFAGYLRLALALFSKFTPLVVVVGLLGATHCFGLIIYHPQVSRWKLSIEMCPWVGPLLTKFPWSCCSNICIYSWSVYAKFHCLINSVPIVLPFFAPLNGCVWIWGIPPKCDFTLGKWRCTSGCKGAFPTLSRQTQLSSVQNLLLPGQLELLQWVVLIPSIYWVA